MREGVMEVSDLVSLCGSFHFLATKPLQFITDLHRNERERERNKKDRQIDSETIFACTIMNCEREEKIM